MVRPSLQGLSRLAGFSMQGLGAAFEPLAGDNAPNREVDDRRGRQLVRFAVKLEPVLERAPRDERQVRPVALKPGELFGTRRC